MHRIQQLLSHVKQPCVYITEAPEGMEDMYAQVFTRQAVDFLSDLMLQFQSEIDQLYENRRKTRCSSTPPCFLPETQHIRENEWKIDDLPDILLDRRCDLGDVSPANASQLHAALQSSAQGVQVDFDDGHCPTWSNSIRGLFNIQREVTSNSTAALLIVRPRAWNMMEKNIILNGRIVPGPVVDFGLHLFHNGRALVETKRGPFLYLSKLESYLEARLWNRIFEWTERQLKLPLGCIKATVLIENISAAFQMHEILYELKSHSSGLNCGIWDYSASIISVFRHSKDFILPNRSEFVSIQCDFIKTYMLLLIETCHRRQAPATTGMNPLIFSNQPDIKDTVAKGKLIEAMAGSDGALVYDIAFIPVVQETFAKVFHQRRSGRRNQVHFRPNVPDNVTKRLLSMPKGSVTVNGVKFNLEIGIRFILAWFQGQGTFLFNNCVEDSATAEISRSQLWQWIRYQCPVDDQPALPVIRECLNEIVLKLNAKSAGDLLWDLITRDEFPDFITTFLSDQMY